MSDTTFNPQLVPLTNLAFTKVFLEVLDEETMKVGGILSITSNVNFTVTGNSLECFFSMWLRFMKKSEDAEDEESTIGRIELSAKGTFALPEDHELEEGDQEFSHDQIGSLLRVMEPVLVAKARQLMNDAGANGSGIPMNLFAYARAQEADSS